MLIYEGRRVRIKKKMGIYIVLEKLQGGLVMVQSECNRMRTFSVHRDELLPVESW